MNKIASFLLSLLLLATLPGCSSTTGNMGSLSISSEPGKADIYINGKLKGITPSRKDETLTISVPLGDYKLESLKPTNGGEDEFYSSQLVSVDGNNQIQLSLKLNKRKSAIFRQRLLEQTGNQTHEPEMVTIPAGTFTMGCVTDIECVNNEYPPHKVNIREFMLSKYELTFEHWDACVARNGCDHYPEDSNWGRGDRPVFDVSWHDVQQYIAWINRETGKKYRLPTESEWEYAVRAGTTTPVYTGSCLSTEMANYDGDLPLQGCEKGIDRKMTLEVGSFPPNDWGLHDMYGNVWEWTQDCWIRHYNDTPTDGSAFFFKDCPRRVLRGGAFNYRGHHTRSAIRYDYLPSIRLRNLGFRLAM